MEIASSWHNKAAAQREAEYYRKHKVRVMVKKAPGHSTTWNVWVDQK